MTMVFESEIATKYGLKEAILLQSIAYWIAKNKANRQNFHDGRYWTFNSVQAYSELYPFLSTKQIRSSLDSLVGQGLIIKGNYNENPYNRTMWYALSDLGEAICLDGQLTVAQEGECKTSNNQVITKKEISKDISKEKHPTREEVREYIKAKGYHFSADEFFDYYSSANWHLSNGKPVRNWKQCCVTWESNHKPSQPTSAVEDHRKRLK